MLRRLWARRWAGCHPAPVCVPASNVAAGGPTHSPTVHGGSGTWTGVVLGAGGVLKWPAGGRDSCGQGCPSPGLRGPPTGPLPRPSPGVCRAGLPGWGWPAFCSAVCSAAGRWNRRRKRESGAYVNTQTCWEQEAWAARTGPPALEGDSGRALVPLACKSGPGNSWRCVGAQVWGLLSLLQSHGSWGV